MILSTTETSVRKAMAFIVPPRCGQRSGVPGLGISRKARGGSGDFPGFQLSEQRHGMDTQRMRFSFFGVLVEQASW